MVKMLSFRSCWWLFGSYINYINRVITEMNKFNDSNEEIKGHQLPVVSKQPVMYKP